MKSIGSCSKRLNEFSSKRNLSVEAKHGADMIFGKRSKVLIHFSSRFQKVACLIRWGYGFKPRRDHSFAKALPKPNSFGKQAWKKKAKD